MLGVGVPIVYTSGSSVPGVAAVLQLSGGPSLTDHGCNLPSVSGGDDDGKVAAEGEIWCDGEVDVKIELEGSVGIGFGGEGICCSSSCLRYLSSSCSSAQPGGPGVGLRPSRKAFAISAAFHFA